MGLFMGISLWRRPGPGKRLPVAIQKEPIRQPCERPTWAALFEATSHLSLAGVDPKAASSEAEARLNLGAVYTALLTLSPEDHERLVRGDSR